MNAARAFRSPAPEPPVNPQELLLEAARAFYLAAAPVPPSPSELIDQLVNTPDPAERLELADRIRRSAP